jgi:hypothetical protein
MTRDATGVSRTTLLAPSGRCLRKSEIFEITRELRSLERRCLLRLTGSSERPLSVPPDVACGGSRWPCPSPGSRGYAARYGGRSPPARAGLRVRAAPRAPGRVAAGQPAGSETRKRARASAGEPASVASVVSHPGASAGRCGGTLLARNRHTRTLGGTGGGFQQVATVAARHTHHIRP